MSQISITTDPRCQSLAAHELSSLLNKLDIRHAVIGGVALRLLGGTRTTEDIDMLMEVPPEQITQVVKPAIVKMSNHFALLGFKMYFSPNLMEGVSGAELIRANKQNVLVETLATATLGLPEEIHPSMIIHANCAESLGEINHDSFFKVSHADHDIVRSKKCCLCCIRASYF